MNQWDYPGEDEVVTTKNLYEVLGVEKDATDAQIKRAYFKLAMVHHPDKRATNPEGSDEIFKQIGYAYQILSDAEKRKVYDLGGEKALEEQQGMANLNLDSLMVNVLMWEPGQKSCFLCVLSIFLLEALIPPLLIAMRLDGTLQWSWFGVTTPLWIPLGIAGLFLLAAPLAIRRNFQAAAEPGADPQLATAARISALACLGTTVFYGCVVAFGVLVCSKLDDPASGWTFQQAAIPYYVVEGLLVLSFMGMPLREAAEGLLTKGGRVATVALLASKLDGSEGIPWVAVLTPLAVVTMVDLAAILWDVRAHRRLKMRGKSKDATLEEEASRYAPFFFALKGVFLIGFALGWGLLCLHLSFQLPVSYAQAAAPVLVGILLSYFMVAWGLLCFRPSGMPDTEYQQFPSEGESYGTFQGGSSDYP